MAPPAGLRARRSNEDRERQGPRRLGCPAFENHRFADCGLAPEPRLEKLGRGLAGGRRGGRRRGGEACHAASTRTCRSGRRAQIQFPGRPLRPRTRQRPRDDFPGRRRRVRQALSGGIRDCHSQPRDRSRRRGARARFFLGRNRGVGQKKTKSCSIASIPRPNNA